MWRNYLIVGIRSLAKNRTFALINILGLAIGMAACLLLLIFVRYELSYDAWMPDAERTFQLQQHYTKPTEGPPVLLQMSSYASGPAFKKEFPQVESWAYATRSAPILLRNGQPEPVKDFFLTDANLLDVLRLPMAKGSRAGALSQQNSLVLSEREAARLFPGEDPIGKTLTVVARGTSMDFKVTGVFRDIPRNSHLRIAVIARLNLHSYFAEQPDFLTHWGNQSGWVYARLRPGADADAIRAGFAAFEKRNIPDEDFGGTRTNQGDISDFALVNVRDVHLGAAQQGQITPGNDRRSILTFAVVGLLILGMACVNFVNLSTARASQRAREVALRKVLGADRRQLIVQFLAESTLVAAVAMLLALALVELLLPPVAAFLEADMRVAWFGIGGIALPALVLVLVVGIAGGLYPALVLSRFQPASVLKANKSAADAHGSGTLRNALVIGQFAVSIGLIICTVVIYAQTVYARSVDPGFRREGILQIDGIGRRQLYPQVETIIREVGKVAGVSAVGITSIGLATDNTSNMLVQLPNVAEPAQLGNYTVDYDFFPAMGVDLVAGRLLDRNRPLDSAERAFPPQPEAERAFAARGVNAVVNELAARRLGFTRPADAVGKQIRASLADQAYGLVPVTIVGVVRDARFRSVRTPLEPTLFTNRTVGSNWMIVRFAGRNPAAVRADVEAAWRRIAPDVPFEARFSDEIMGELYAAEDARARIFAGFALLAVIVGCLGLFGLATFTAERRTKEIGIRKVLGARTQDIVRLLVWQFSRPVLVANLLAWPIAWWLMRDWLNGFDARIALGPAPFVAAGLLALLIAVATIGGHALRVARANPIHALRYE
ncbi:ABC transporter permease [Sphingomonas jatrophae]|uniref:Putative ABC transport system permease protein n=1 Tax=Sphingomonas jatrophae TaxID=1166337 RepID=A0A1I6L231_9SPHN|nr:ABC transporter permease [Sphingomonas jatrophae]SFR97506.1 putative ABC transport system permease protein [Sphingomonas jatrophae]